MDGRAGKEGQSDARGGVLLPLSRPDASFLALLAVLPDCLAALAKARSGGGVWNTPSYFFLLMLFCQSIPSQAFTRPAWPRLPRRETFASLAVSYLQWAWSECYSCLADGRLTAQDPARSMITPLSA